MAGLGWRRMGTVGTKGTVASSHAVPPSGLKRTAPASTAPAGRHTNNPMVLACLRRPAAGC